MMSKNNEQYCRKLCRAFIEAGIPLYKLNSPSLRSFLTDISGHEQPSEALIRKVYVDREYDAEMERMRSVLKTEYIWISIDETSDAKDRAVVCVLAGALQESSFGPHFLICSEQYKQVNNTTISQVNNLILKYR